MKFLAFFFLASPLYALAPPPVNFEREIITIKDTKLLITFHDGKMDMEEITPDMERNWGCFWGCLITTVFSGSFMWVYYVVIAYLFSSLWAIQVAFYMIAFSIGYIILNNVIHQDINPILIPPDPGEVCRMTVNFKAANKAVVSYEVFWSDEKMKWMGEVAGEEFEIDSLPDENDERIKIWPTEWA